MNKTLYDQLLLLLTIISIIFLSNNVSASIIFGGKAYAGEEFNAGEFKFILSETRDNDTIVLSEISGIINKSYIIKLNETKETDEFIINYYTKRFDLQNGFGKLNSITKLEMYEHLIWIESKYPEIHLNSYISKQEPGINDEVEIKINCSNSGNSPAKNFLFKLDIPDDVKIITQQNLIKENNTLYWKGNLINSEEFSFKITSDKETNINFKPYIEYYFNNQRNLYSANITAISFSPGILINSEVNFTWPQLGEFVLYDCIVKNTKNYSQQNKLNIDFPIGFEVLYQGVKDISGNIAINENYKLNMNYETGIIFNQNDYKNTIKIDNNDKSKYNEYNYQFSWEGELSGDTSRIYRFILQPRLIRNGSINSKLSSLDYQDIYKLDNRKIWTNYNIPEISILYNSSEINDEFSDMKKSNYMHLVVLLKNKDFDKILDEFFVYIDSSMTESMEIYKPIKIIEKDEDFIAFNLVIEPKISMGQIPFVTTKVNYITQFGENISILYNKTIIKDDISNTKQYLIGEYEDIFYEPEKPKPIYEKIFNFFKNILEGFIFKITGTKKSTPENILLIPILLMVIFIGAKTISKWDKDKLNKTLRLNEIKENITSIKDKIIQKKN